MDETESDDVEREAIDAELFARVVELLRRRRSEPRSDELSEQLRQARTALDDFHRANPESVAALRLQAELHLALGDLPMARRAINQAEELDPWNLEILIISESLYDVEGRHSRGSPGQAVHIDSELSSEVINPEQLTERAMGAFQLGDLEHAYSLAKLAYRLAPDKPHLLLDVWTIGSSTDPQRARQELVDLLREEPAQPYLYLALGSVDNVLAIYDEAAAWLERGLALEPKDPYVLSLLLNELAYVLAKRGERLEDCVRFARTALEVFPDYKANGFIRDTLGVVYLKLGELDKSIRNLREAVAKDPTVIPRFHLALGLLHQRDAAGAMAELKAIAAARPSLENPHAEETAILDRVQRHIARIEDLLHLGGADDLRDALAILDGLV